MYPTNGYPILPVGMVNLETGRNKEYGTIWNIWEEDENDTYLLLQDRENRKFRAVITSSPIEQAEKYHKIGQVIELYHDQSGARFGGWNGWEVIGLFHNTAAGLKEMKAACKKSSIPFATFK